jgi:hypothetical protein
MDGCSDACICVRVYVSDAPMCLFSPLVWIWRGPLFLLLFPYTYFLLSFRSLGAGLLGFDLIRLSGQAIDRGLHN